MKRAAVVLALALAGCVHPAYRVQPELFVNLSVAPQTCARKDGTAEVYVFVTRVGLPPGPIRGTLDGRVSFDLYGDTVTFHYLRVGVGSHTFRAEAEGLAAERSFGVYYCEEAR